MDLLEGGGTGIAPQTHLLRQRGELAVEVVPFLEAHIGQELVVALLDQLALGFPVGAGFLEEGPDPDQPHEVGMLVAEAAVALVGGAFLSQRPDVGILDRQRGGDDEHLGQAVLPVGGEQHAADLRVHRQFGQFPADGGEAPRLVHRPQLVQQAVAVRDHAPGGRLQEGKLAHRAQFEGLHAQDGACQGRAQDLGIVEAGALLEVLLAVQAYAHARGHAPAPPGPLVGAGLGDGLDQQLVHLVAVGIALDPGITRIDHIADAGHGEGSLRHVGGENDAPGGVGFEHPVLFLPRLTGIEGQDRHAGRMVLAQQLRGVADLPLAGQEHQDVAVPGQPRDLIHRIDDGLLQVALARVLVLALHGAVADLHRIQPAGDLDHRRIAEVSREQLRVDGGGGDDDLQVGTPRQQALEIAQQEVDVEAALVGLVDDDGVIGEQGPVVLRLGEQDAVGHELDEGTVADRLSGPALSWKRTL